MGCKAVWCYIGLAIYEHIYIYIYAHIHIAFIICDM